MTKRFLLAALVFTFLFAAAEASFAGGNTNPAGKKAQGFVQKLKNLVQKKLGAGQGAGQAAQPPAGAGNVGAAKTNAQKTYQNLRSRILNAIKNAMNAAAAKNPGANLAGLVNQAQKAAGVGNATLPAAPAGAVNNGALGGGLLKNAVKQAQNLAPANNAAGAINQNQIKQRLQAQLKAVRKLLQQARAKLIKRLRQLKNQKAGKKGAQGG